MGAGARDGSVLISILLSPPNEGYHELPDNPLLDMSAVLSVTRWKLENGTVVCEPATLVTEGAVTLDHVDDTSVSGSAEARTSNGDIELVGSFTASVCGEGMP